MNIQICTTNQEKEQFIKFIYSIYLGSDCFVDMSVFVLKDILFEKNSFSKGCFIQAVKVCEDNRTLCQCLLTYEKQLDILQFGFFDSLTNQEQAVKLLIEHAKKVASSLNLKKIAVGLNGHLSYGVGILQDCFDKKITFDSPYNHSYYPAYFEHLESESLTTYKIDIKLASERLQKFNTVVKKNREITFRYLDKKKYEEDLKIFNRLCNITLADTSYYYPVNDVHMYELMSGMKHLLDEENIIFAMHNGVEIGYIYWHPDFNEVLKYKNSLLSILVKMKFSKNKIKNFKINTIGVIPKYRNGITITLLISKLLVIVRGKYKTGETSFVWNDNTQSTLLCKNFFSNEYRHYKVYNIDL